ncbi:hypothetical protein MPSEU_000026900 [Mayamaea pseudoterrestris]|nr:hypothetical protein MPSEU_000026900 [Mayamaea pseudoterrestris]
MSRHIRLEWIDWQAGVSCDIFLSILQSASTVSQTPPPNQEISLEIDDYSVDWYLELDNDRMNRILAALKKIPITGLVLDETSSRLKANPRTREEVRRFTVYRSLFETLGTISTLKKAVFRYVTWKSLHGCALRCLPQNTSLELMSPYAAFMLEDCLRDHRVLECIVLKVPLEQLPTLLPVLQTLPSLGSVSVTSMGDDRLNPEIAQAIANMLVDNKPKLRLRLHCIFFTEESHTILCAGIVRARIKAFEIDYFIAGDATTLATAMASSHLKELIISNGLFQNGDVATFVAALSRGMQSMERLEKLVCDPLRSNYVGEDTNAIDGAMADIARALNNCPRINFVKLDVSSYSPLLDRALADCISGCPLLEVIQVTYRKSVDLTESTHLMYPLVRGAMEANFSLKRVVLGPIMTTKSTHESRARAHGRWNLLRDALLSSKQRQQAEDQAHHNEHANDSHSIHRFPGYSLIQAQKLAQESRDVLVEKFSVVDASDWKIWTEQIKSALLVRLALLEETPGKEPSITVSFDFTLSNCSHHQFDESSLVSLQAALSSRLLVKLGLEWITVAGTNGNRQLLRINVDRSELEVSSSHAIMEYLLPNTHQSILVRQKSRRRASKLSLTELASHQFHDGIDNTGNVCVWDAEKTLAWVMLQEQDRMMNVKIVTELGVGMAGLAALTCATVSSHIEDLYLTDGHIDCVRNNQVNALLWRLNNNERNTRIHAMQLLWTMDMPDSSRPPAADWTLVSDCTHFQEYHGALLWTLVQCTKVGGIFWMCQPNRGQSWDRFCNVVEFVNDQSNVPNPLLALQEQTYATLDNLHEQFLQQPDSHYDPNIHRPRVFCLLKLREATERDRQLVIQHIETRDNK